MSKNGGKKRDGPKDEWENDGVVHCKARTKIPLSLGSKTAVPSSRRGRISSPIQEQSGIRGLSSWVALLSSPPLGLLSEYWFYFFYFYFIDFIFLGSKVTTDGDCSHEIKRRLLLGRKVMTNRESIFKSRDITLPTKVRLVKAMVFPVVMYGCES